MTTSKLLLPAGFLALVQLMAFLFYGGFSLTLRVSTELLVVCCYFFFMLSLFVFSMLDRKEMHHSPSDSTSLVGRNDMLIMPLGVALIFLFVTLPTIKLTLLSVELGPDYVRNNIFKDELRVLVFGSVAKSALTNLYLIPFLWWIAIVYSTKPEKVSKCFFWFVLISIVAFNLSYAGRNAIYYMMLVIYFSYVIRGNSVFLFLRKNLMLLVVMFFLAFVVVSLRVTSKEVTLLGNIFSLFEYHVLQPFLFAQKIEMTEWVDLYPFETAMKSLFFPVLYVAGVDHGDTPVGMYANQFYDFTLYSFSSMRYYNSFTTFFPFFYAETRIFSPIFIFFFTFGLLCSTYLVQDWVLRKKLQAYIGLMLFFSLFKFEILTPGVLLIISCVIFYGVVMRFNKVGKGGGDMIATTAVCQSSKLSCRVWL